MKAYHLKFSQRLPSAGNSEVTVKAISAGVIFARFIGEEKKSHASAKGIGRYCSNFRSYVFT